MTPSDNAAQSPTPAVSSIAGSRGQPGGWFLFLRGQEKEPKEGRPGVATCGFPVLPDPARRLWNSTWQGTQNVPCHGTASVPGGRSLGRNPRRERVCGQPQSEALRLFPQTELRLTCHTRTVLADFPSPGRAARRDTRGRNSCNGGWRDTARQSG